MLTCFAAEQGLIYGHGIPPAQRSSQTWGFCYCICRHIGSSPAHKGGKMSKGFSRRRIRPAVRTRQLKAKQSTNPPSFPYKNIVGYTMQSVIKKYKTIISFPHKHFAASFLNTNHCDSPWQYKLRCSNPSSLCCCTCQEKENKHPQNF